MPLPGSRVIHRDWAARNRPVAEGTLEDRLQIRRPGGTGGAFDPNTGATSSTPHPPYYDGMGSVQVLPGIDQARDQAGQQVSTLGYRVSIVADSPEPQPGDIVRVVTPGPNSDALLQDREMTVRSAETGSAHWTRDLICTDDLG